MPGLDRDFEVRVYGFGIVFLERTYGCDEWGGGDKGFDLEPSE